MDKHRYGFLPETLFKCKYDPRYLYSKEDYEYKGVMDGYNYQDNVFTPIKDKPYILTSLITIPAMVEIYKNGGDIVLVNGDDIGKVYFIIEDYLNEPYDDQLRQAAIDRTPAWYKPHLDNRISLLDKFSQEMYTKNKERIERYRSMYRTTKSPIISHFNKFRGITNQDVINKKNKPLISLKNKEYNRITVYNKGKI